MRGKIVKTQKRREALTSRRLPAYRSAPGNRVFSKCFLETLCLEWVRLGETGYAERVGH